MRQYIEDPERIIYAFHLLERLKNKGLTFTFKGGISVVLLPKEGIRRSIDMSQMAQYDGQKHKRISDRKCRLRLLK